MLFCLFVCLFVCLVVVVVLYVFVVVVVVVVLGGGGLWVAVGGGELISTEMVCLNVLKCVI